MCRHLGTNHSHGSSAAVILGSGHGEPCAGP
jgi:hypothetical protein